MVHNCDEYNFNLFSQNIGQEILVPVLAFKVMISQFGHVLPKYEPGYATIWFDFNICVP